VIRQLGNSRPRPQVTQRTVTFIRLTASDIETTDVLALTCLPGQLNRSRNWSTPFTKQNDRTLRQQIRKSHRIHFVSVEAKGSNLDIGQHRCLNVLAKLVGDSFSFRFFSDDKRLTHAGLRNAFDEVTIYRSADAEREDIATVQIGANMIEHS